MGHAVEPRRRDRAVTDPRWMRDLLERSRLGVLGLPDGDEVYLNPNLFVHDPGAEAIYLHGTPEGRLAGLTAKPRPASFSVQHLHRILPAERAFGFSAKYDSLILTGTIERVRDDGEARRVLRAFMDKYAGWLEYGVDYGGIRDADLPLTAVHRFRITSWMGKSNPGPEGDGFHVRGSSPGDLGVLFSRHAKVYKEEFGYSDVFETYVAKGLPVFLEHFDPRLDRLWIAEDKDGFAGSVAIAHKADRPGWAQLRWYLVEKRARGRGLGRMLLERAVTFAREAGYEGVLLWTVDDLHAARRQYEAAGFRLAEETDGCPWAAWGKEQRWERVFGDG